MKTSPQHNAAMPPRRRMAAIALTAIAAWMLPATTLAQSAPPGLSANVTVVARGFDIAVGNIRPEAISCNCTEPLPLDSQLTKTEH